VSDDAGRDEFFARFPVPRETSRNLIRFAQIVLENSTTQNLIAQSTVATFWHRHMLDSAQLLSLAPPAAQTWLDVGSGAGFPGLVLAILTNVRHTLVEPRRLRADFLSRTVEELGLTRRVDVVCTKIEKFHREPVSVITARAFAPLTRTLKAATHLADLDTTWLLPKGRTAADEVVAASAEWDADIDLLPSLTDPESSVVRLTRVCPKASA